MAAEVRKRLTQIERARSFADWRKVRELADREGIDIRYYTVIYQALEEVEAALKATAQQLASVATGEGTTGWIPHTYGIIERYMPDQVKAMHAARQQHAGP